MGWPTSTGNRWKTGMVHEKRRDIERFTLVTVLVVVSLIIMGFIGWSLIANWLRSPDDFYLLPRNAADWTGWATGMGALGTSGALIYAAMKFRSDAEEQRNLRLDRDAEAKTAANSLAVSISLHSPGEDIRDVSGLRLTLTNYGKERFTDVQVKFPDVLSEITLGQSASIPPDLVEDDPSFGKAEEDWADMNPQPLPVGDGGQLWLCGDVPPRSIISLSVVFDEIQSDGQWELTPVERTSSKTERKGRIAVIFSDYKGRTWIRSTEGRRPLQRLWPEAFIVEQQRLSARDRNSPTPRQELADH